MKPHEKALELFYKFNLEVSQNLQSESFQSATISKQCALIAVDRNIQIFKDLVNRMDDFSNESRGVIYQLIENEEQVKTEIEKL